MVHVVLNLQLGGCRCYDITVRAAAEGVVIIHSIP